MIDEANGASDRLRAERALGADGRARGLVFVESTSSPRSEDQVAMLTRSGSSRRECEVAMAIVRGKTTKEIGDGLAVSVHTITEHVRSTFDKLGVSSRLQLAFRVAGRA